MQELDEEERPPALTGEVTISEQAAEGLKEQAVE
jgi:hypothetical protein